MSNRTPTLYSISGDYIHALDVLTDPEADYPPEAIADTLEGIEGELQEADLEVSYWRDDELALFCSPDDPLAAKSVLDDADLVSANWIVREIGSGTRQAFDRAMSGILPSLNLRLELQHTEGIKRAVEAGLGIGCLSRLTLEEAFKRGSLVPLQCPHRNLTRKFYFILHRQKFLGHGVRSWMEHCQNT